MRCPLCSSDDTRVIDSRLGDGGEGVRRRRECIDCSQRFTTFENIVFDMPRVIKADGRREKFNQGKLRRGLTRALEKRPVKMEQIEGMVNRIMYRFTHKDQEVAVGAIGEAVMYELRQLDEVAYVRFASVYRSFQDLEAFSDEVEKLKKSLSGREIDMQSSFIPTEDT